MSRSCWQQSKDAVDGRGCKVAVFEFDNVSSGNDLTRAGGDDRSPEHQWQGCESDEVETHAEEFAMKEAGELVGGLIFWAEP